MKMPEYVAVKIMPNKKGTSYSLEVVADTDFVNVVRCKDCKRNADNGGLYPNGRTQCPIQEHYALLQDGYCHLAECKEVQRNFNASNTLDALETEVTE